MNQNLVKSNVLRQRFLCVENSFEDIFNKWPIHHFNLLNFLNHHTKFQIMGEKIFFTKNGTNDSFNLMLPVIGVPFSDEKSQFFVKTIEESELFVFNVTAWDIYTFDKVKLMDLAEEISKKLEKKLNILHKILYHIVFNKEKIELHFFYEKDYIDF